MDNIQDSKGEIIIYTSENGLDRIEVVQQDDMLWLNTERIAELFNKDRTTIQRHIKNIFNDNELDKDSTCAFFAQVQNEGNRTVLRKIPYYNLDVILAVGYRVSSKIATKFRRWATEVLHKYIMDGYVINQKQLQAKQNKIEALQTTVSLLSRSLNNQIENIDEAQQVAKLLDNFAKGLDLLDNFDHKTLDTKGQTNKDVVRISTAEFLKVIDQMKSEFASDVFANPKDNSFESSVNQIYQTFGEQDCYPTLEEKAAMLLYLITKNHSFSDGNKRIAASCFLYFLDKNNMLYRNSVPIIDNGTLFALTILIAESNPKEMDTMKQIVVSVLNRSSSFEELEEML